MGSGAPDIRDFFAVLDECVDCNFSDSAKFVKFADYFSIAKIEDTEYINGIYTTSIGGRHSRLHRHIKPHCSPPGGVGATPMPKTGGDRQFWGTGTEGKGNR